MKENANYIGSQYSDHHLLCGKVLQLAKDLNQIENLLLQISNCCENKERKKKKTAVL